MRSPIVHIGFHKTATKWFQEAVYPRVRNLRWVSRATTQAALLEPSALVFDPEEAARVLGASAGPVLLCEENLSGYPHNGGLHGFLTQAVAQRIAATLPEARIVVLVRSQPEMISACYQQYVRGGGTYSVQRYLWPRDWLRGAASQPFKIARFSFDHFEYDRIVALYAGLFGPRRVHVFPFEAFQRDERGFLESFAKTLDLDLDSAAVPLAKLNSSYSPSILGLTRVLNRFTARTVNEKHHWLHVPLWYGARRRLVEALNHSGAFGARASVEQVLGERALAWVRQRYCASNRRLAQLVDWDPAAFGYPMDPPLGSAERPQRAAWRRWAAV